MKKKKKKKGKLHKMKKITNSNQSQIQIREWVHMNLCSIISYLPPLMIFCSEEQGYFLLA
jgi:hypothetical protein